MVWDRMQVSPKGIKARYYWFLDWLSMRLADVILFDTQAHIDYASKEFNIRKGKFKKILVGAQTDVFFPRVIHKTKNKFLVLFFGTYIPLQGIEYIIDAAKFLKKENIEFRIIGDGQQKKKILKYTAFKQTKNIEFPNFMSSSKLVLEIANADVCLGIFGNTNKAQRVIPNKVYQYLAMKKPVITADTPALRELFSDNDVLFVDIASSTSLANGILHLKNNKKTMENIAQNGYDTLITNATPSILGAQLKKNT